MSKKVNSKPAGYHSVTPYLIVRDAARAIEFYKKVFDASELLRLPGTDGKIGHAELKIGDSVIMLADEFPSMGAQSPKSLNGTPVNFMLYVEDVDATVKSAIAAGAKLTRAVEDRFYGDRNGQIQDPFGHDWTVSTHVRDVSEEEMKKGAAAAVAAGS